MVVILLATACLDHCSSKSQYVLLYLLSKNEKYVLAFSNVIVCEWENVKKTKILNSSHIDNDKMILTVCAVTTEPTFSYTINN